MESIIARLNRSEANAILKILPLARFSPLVYQQLIEDRDTRTSQNLLSAFQLHELRAIYHTLLSRIPGVGMLFPLLAKQIEGEQPGYRVFWVGEHDPFDLCDVILLHVWTTWKAETNAFDLTITWEVPDAKGCYCGYRQDIREHARQIMLHLQPDQFDQIFRDFFTALRPLIPCPRKSDDGFSHAVNCTLCNGRGELYQHEAWGPKFRPSCWFEMVAGFSGWTDTRS